MNLKETPQCERCLFQNETRLRVCFLSAPLLNPFGESL